MIKRRHFLVGVFLFFISQLARVKSSPSVSLDTQLVRKWITFEDLPDIKEIKLNGKEIEMINETAFSGMINLELLDLSLNKLASLPANVFRGKYIPTAIYGCRFLTHNKSQFHT